MLIYTTNSSRSRLSRPFPSFAVLSVEKPSKAAAGEAEGGDEEEEACPEPDHWGPDCQCFEDDTAYFSNNHRLGSENPQPSRVACQESCAETPECNYWTWGKGSPMGPCYLKTKRENVTPGLKDYVSGAKNCKLPETMGLG